MLRAALASKCVVAAPIAIDDPADPRLADYLELSDPELRRRVEAEQGFFIAESVHVVRRLLASPHRVRSVLLTPALLDALATELEGRSEPVYVAPLAVLRAVAGFNLHRGVVAAADRWPLPPRLRSSPTRVALLWVRDSTTTRTWECCFATRPRSASTRCCSIPRAPILCTGGACGSRSVTC